jgi:RHS repeat-associated protein
LDGHEQLDGSSSIYTLDMDYNKAGSITFKNGNGSSFMNATALTYGLEYNYDPSKDHQLDHIWDPASGTTTSFKYNTSGSITQIDDPAQAIPQDFFWNEQQQLTGVKNQQGVHHYIYDHQGERLMKSSLINTSVYLNDQVIDNVTNLDPYTVYVNPFYVVTGLLGGDRVSKHYYMNQQRVATDITINYDPNGGGGGGEYAPSKGLDDLKEVVQELSHEPLDTSILELPSIADYYPETATAKSSSFQAEGAGSSGRILFWYHPDYLGNVDLVTEIDGFAHEFFIYNPWGEEMHQWNANTYAFTSPYRFNSKELDPETGLAYYGARYYQNKMGVWLSVDRLASKYTNISPFVYGGNNSLAFIDPNGDSLILTFTRANNTLTVINWDNFQKGLPWKVVSPEQYQEGGIKNANGEQIANQVLLIKGVFTGGQSSPTGITYGNSKDEKPLPPGRYEILNDGDDAGYYRLDAIDSAPRNDQYDNEKYLNADGGLRSHMRLHSGSLSYGCATINKYDQQAMKGWNILDKMLQTTSTSLTRDRMGFMNTLGLTNTQVIRYGKMIVR